MVGTRTATAILGVSISLSISAAAWVLFDYPFLFLVVPFVPFLFRFPREETASAPILECPACGYRTRDPAFEFCPRDGRQLEERTGGRG